MLGESYLTKLTKDKTKLPGANFGLDQLRFVKKVVNASIIGLRNLVVPHRSDQSGESRGYDHSMEPIWNMLRQDTANNIVPTNSKLSKSSKSALPTNNIQPFGNNSKQPAMAQQANQNMQAQLAQQRQDTQTQQNQAQKTLRQGRIEQQSSFGSG